MGRSLSLAETMTLISSKISGLVPFSSCALFVREQNTLRCRFATGINAHLMRDAEVEEGIGPCGWVARHERPIVNGLPNAEWNGVGLDSRETLLESALVCPLIVGSRLIGTIGVFHVAAGCYTDDHRRVLEEICQQASAVIHNALVFEQTQDEALKDGLTGLANARALHSHAARELGRAQRTGLQFSLVVLDLDDFKSINDTYGHLAGDRALREVATALRETTRPYDMCIRYGGDEFVVLLASCGRTEAEERRRTFQETVAAITLETEHGEPIPLSISAGVGVFPEDGDTLRTSARQSRSPHVQGQGGKKKAAAARPRRDDTTAGSCVTTQVGRALIICAFAEDWRGQLSAALHAAPIEPQHIPFDAAASPRRMQRALLADRVVFTPNHETGEWRLTGRANLRDAIEGLLQPCEMVPRTGIEPVTPAFSVLCSTD